MLSIGEFPLELGLARLSFPFQIDHAGPRAGFVVMSFSD
jgi:hypothetical protein